MSCAHDKDEELVRLRRLRIVRMRNKCTIVYEIMKAVRMRNELGLCACANVERILAHAREGYHTFAH